MKELISTLHGKENGCDEEQLYKNLNPAINVIKQKRNKTDRNFCRHISKF
jgi:hypothetical protein